ncbi:uncharacterized protein Z519_12786 [Cladophialophora bantiana CBS 173.52]|uniref:Uncharacterized protein n=1 Tax=Cladophialophora bantiana (strain ATCC 10958 / CBS 173.52 / CDC B-1940 / NIH 8579) TaxID=1442370 RepID=A0A0D2FIS7_CLAB1|nr:uncharacterized protein Z519_12786 [Cladophialophora bantiana CBS 173.52]KIW86602.1 hypothetical protein Z519_12786 [Cladophialophora bantiana CBS 173.52]
MIPLYPQGGAYAHCAVSTPYASVPASHGSYNNQPNGPYTNVTNSHAQANGPYTNPYGPPNGPYPSPPGHSYYGQGGFRACGSNARPPSPSSDDSEDFTDSDEAISSKHHQKIPKNKTSTVPDNIITSFSDLLKKQNEKIDVLDRQPSTNEDRYKQQAQKQKEKAGVEEPLSTGVLDEKKDVSFFVNGNGIKFQFPCWKCRTLEAGVTAVLPSKMLTRLGDEKAH